MKQVYIKSGMLATVVGENEHYYQLEYVNQKGETVHLELLKIECGEFLEKESQFSYSPIWLRVSRNTISSTIKDFYCQWIENTLDLNPAYQRDIVWTDEQQSRYIQALFRHKIPKIQVTCCLQIDGDVDVLEVLDGKQRLTSIFKFLHNEICLPNGVYFKDLGQVDRFKFLRYDIQYIRLTVGDFARNLTNEEKLEIFLEINELGTKMSDADLNKAKQILS